MAEVAQRIIDFGTTIGEDFRKLSEVIRQHSFSTSHLSELLKSHWQSFENHAQEILPLAVHQFQVDQNSVKWYGSIAKSEENGRAVVLRSKSFVSDLSSRFSGGMRSSATLPSLHSYHNCSSNSSLSALPSSSTSSLSNGGHSKSSYKPLC